MSTVPIRCPYCGMFIRVSAQPSVITRNNQQRGQLLVHFDSQKVAHICPTDEGVSQ